MRSKAIREFYSSSEVQAGERLLALIAPHETVRVQYCQRFHQEIAQHGDPEYFAELSIMWILATFTGFYVDWKDDESFKPFVEKLAHDRGVRDFFFPPNLRTETDELPTVPELMHWAHHALEGYGLLLWHWDTEEDNYCGAICAEKDWPEVLAVCASLGVAALPGSMRFGDEIDA